jgi:hypothetical protein
MIGFRGWALAAFAALVGSPAAAPPAPVPPAAAEFESRPGVGAVCAAGLYTLAAEVGRRCVTDRDPAIQVELDAAVARIDAFLLADPEWDLARLDRFKRDQLGIGSADSEFCSGDAVMIYRAYAAAGAEKLKASSEKVVARPGRPTWGDCL